MRGPAPPSLSAGSGGSGGGSDSTELHRAAERGDHESIKAVLARAAPAGSAVVAALVSGKDLLGVTPLEAAAAEGHLRACRELIKAGAEIDEDAIKSARLHSQYDVLINFLGRTQPPEECITARRDRKREMIVIELAKTERKYVEGLATLIDEVLGPCMRHSAAKAAIIEALEAAETKFRKSNGMGTTPRSGETSSVGSSGSFRSTALSADPWHAAVKNEDSSGSASGSSSRPSSLNQPRRPSSIRQNLRALSQGLSGAGKGAAPFASSSEVSIRLARHAHCDNMGTKADRRERAQRLATLLTEVATDARSEVVSLFDLETDFDPDAWPSLDQAKTLSGQVEQVRCAPRARRDRSTRARSLTRATLTFEPSTHPTRTAFASAYARTNEPRRSLVALPHPPVAPRESRCADQDVDATFDGWGRVCALRTFAAVSLH